jgi:hypothetical protein
MVRRYNGIIYIYGLDQEITQEEDRIGVQKGPEGVS